MKFSQVILQAMRELGMNQTQFAELVCVPRQCIGLYISEKRPVALKHALKIEDAFLDINLNIETGSLIELALLTHNRVSLANCSSRQKRVIAKVLSGSTSLAKLIEVSKIRSVYF